jgi:Icc-related predicted phosphoesterase
MFVGATLWTNFNNNKASEKVAAKYIADFKRIKGFSTDNARALYNKHYDFIKNTTSDLPTVVVTHFMPSKLAVHPRWAREDYPIKQLNDYFANDLDDLILTNQPNYWLFGHTHDSINTKLGDTKLIANPFGYLGHEVNPRFDEALTIDPRL